ncbi:hypothetical protein WN943_015538 [Citrus x changshan-huyou]
MEYKRCFGLDRVSESGHTVHQNLEKHARLQSFFELILSCSNCLVSAVAASVLVLSVVTCARFNSAGINKSLHARFVHGIKKVCAKCLGLLEHIDIAHLPGIPSLYQLDHIDKSLSE